MRRLDDLQYRGLRLMQDTDLFCFGMDAVILADFAEVRDGDVIADLGCGNGILPVLLSAKSERAVFYGVEYQSASAELAMENARINGISGRFFVINEDLRLAELPRQVTAVVMNPPYERLGSGGLSSSEAQRIARHEVMCTLEDAAAAASRLLKTGGRLYMIHRAARAAELLCTLGSRRLTPKLLRFVHPKPQKEAGYVLMKCVKDGSPGISVPPPLIVRDAEGIETPELRRIYHKDMQ